MKTFSLCLKKSQKKFINSYLEAKERKKESKFEHCIKEKWGGEYCKCAKGRKLYADCLIIQRHQNFYECVGDCRKFSLPFRLLYCYFCCRKNFCLPHLLFIMHNTYVSHFFFSNEIIFIFSQKVIHSIFLVLRNHKIFITLRKEILKPLHV
jgi:hypothetical protein